MSVDRGITGSSSEVLSFSVGNVFSVSLDVSLGQSKVDEKNFMGSLIESDAEVVRFDVPVEEVSVVDILNPRDHLVDEHKHRLQREFPEGVFEETFEGGTHQIHHKNVVVACISL